VATIKFHQLGNYKNAPQRAKWKIHMASILIEYIDNNKATIKSRI